MKDETEGILAWIGLKTRRAFGRVGRRWRFLRSFAVALLTDGRTWRSLLSGQLARVGVDSVPIGIFIAAFTGVVMSLQASYTLTGAIPEYFVGTLVGKTMILELGPVLTALTLAGRVGADIAAELGSMRVTEQVDALETLAWDPIAYLVVPRVAAAALMFPIVTVLAIGVGIGAAWITSMELVGLSSEEFVKGLQLFFRPWDVWYAVIKSVSFGAVVACEGCFWGLSATGGARGVGASTRQAVVAASMLILVLDAFWAATIL